MRFPPGRTSRVIEAPILKLKGEVKIPEDAISLGQGSPFFGPPAEAVEAAREAMGSESGYRYGPDVGSESLRVAICEKLRRENGIDAEPDSGVMVTSGGNQAFVNALLAVTDVGDEVVLFSPYYFNHLMAVEMAGCRPVIVPTGDDFLPGPSAVEECLTARTRMMVTVSPGNPTGAVWPGSLLGEVNGLCSDREIYHVSDEAYEHYVFEGEGHTSPGSLPGASEHTISLFSFSKSFGMAGYRVGYMAYPPHLHGELLKVQDTIAICPSVPMQRAAEEAVRLGAEYPGRYIDGMRRTRESMARALGGLGGVRLSVTRGGFYHFPVLKTERTSWDMAKELVEEHGVITIPGEVFGASRPSLRVSYGNVEGDVAEEGLKRLVEGLKGILQR